MIRYRYYDVLTLLGYKLTEHGNKVEGFVVLCLIYCLMVSYHIVIM